jgi:hypothetical protein
MSRQCRRARVKHDLPHRDGAAECAKHQLTLHQSRCFLNDQTVFVVGVRGMLAF